VRSKNGDGDLTMGNPSMSDESSLYKVAILAFGLGILALPLVLLALIFF
jgi:hypothetical protein